MKIHKSYIAIGMIVAFTLFVELAAHADEPDQATTITFSQPVQVPGQILPAGTYLFKLATADDRNVVQIFSSDWSRLYATLETIPTQSGVVPDETTVTLVEHGAGQPDVLLNWFYPGNDSGHQFIYSNPVEKEIAHGKRQKVVANQEPATDSEAGGSN